MPTAMNGGGYMGNTAPMMAQDEAGATDNRLSLNPNDPQWKTIMDSWEDGGTYTLKEVEVRQVSPGEFQVLSANAGAAEEPEQTETPEPTDTETTGLMGKAAPGSDNPAVARMMAGEE